MLAIQIVWTLMLYIPVILPFVYNLLNCSSTALVDYQNPSQGYQSYKECLCETDTASKDVSDCVSTKKKHPFEYGIFWVETKDLNIFETKNFKRL